MITNTTYRILVEKLGDSEPNQFVGNEGELFYDPSSPSLSLSDGSTIGGLGVVGGGGGAGTQGSQGLQGRQGSQGLSNQGVQGLSNQGTQGLQGRQGSQGLSNQGVQGLSNQGTQGTQGLSNQGSQGSQGLSNQGVQGLSNQGTQGTQGLSNQGTQGTQGLSNQGVQGLSNQGTQGTQGLSNQGTQGSQGLSNQGTQGLSGDQGTQGLSGDQGTQGVQGLQGTQGLSGESFNQGTQGLSGDQGTQGLSGDQGTQGLSGDQGTQGLSGDQGTQGLSGDQGTQGLSGDQGTQGLSGDQGVQGVQGLQGIQGLSGESFNQGTQGLSGDQGTQGIEGYQGTQGLSNQGVQGIQGEPGSTVSNESYWELNNAGIHTTSNVGIGTTNPTSPLTVFGDAKISDIKISGTQIIGDGSYSNLGGLQLIPNDTLIGTGQYVKLRPTTNFDQTHIHIEAGSVNNADLYLGDDDRFVKIDHTGPVVIGVPATATTSNWTAPSDDGPTTYIGIDIDVYPWTQYLTTGDTITLPDTTVVNIINNYLSGNIMNVYLESNISYLTNDILVFSYRPRTEWEFNSDSSALFPGNVGIGTTNPTSALTVVGDTLVSGVVTATSYNGSGSNLTGIVTSITAGSGISVNQNSGNVTITSFGSSEGSWTVSAGSGTYSFTVPENANYVMWMRGNIPNGICIWNATVSISNSNVPVIGNQYSWYYATGNQLVLTAIPSQIIGTSGSIITSSPAVSNSNIFSFGITNNSGTNQTVSYGYIKI
jgi:hypothetical protein